MTIFLSHDNLYHISASPGIVQFEPRPSPSYFEHIKGNVVFAIAGKLLHNYLLPRECPRVTFYCKQDTVSSDKEKFFGPGSAEFVVAVENNWYPAICAATLYCYELPTEHFIPLDEGAGYYISYQSISSVCVTVIDDILAELLKRNVELRFMPSLHPLAEQVAQSSLQFSLIRMRNAI